MEHKSTINTLFSPRKNNFAVPNYQRAYSWEKEKHVQQFLRDIKDHPDSVAQYHLGHFLFEQDEQVTHKYWIIDGQQRLTTVVLFMCAVHERLKGDVLHDRTAQNIYHDYLLSTEQLQKFQTVEYDNNFFYNLVIDHRSDKEDTRSRKKLREALDYFKAQIREATIDEVIHWHDLIENAKITTDIVGDKAEAAQIFTFQNDRGKDLTNLEKLKAFLMLQIFVSCKHTGIDPNSAIGYVEKEFETIYKALEKIYIAGEDQILNYHVTAFLPHADSALDRVRNALTKESVEQRQHWIRNFVVELKRSFEFSITIQDKRKTHSRIADVLFLDQPNSFPLLLKLFHYHEEDRRLEKVYRLIEIILFRLNYTTGSYYTNNLPAIAYQYTNRNLDELVERLRHLAKTGFQHYWNFEGDFHRKLDGDHHYTSATRYLLWKYENSLRDGVREPYMLFSDFRNMYGNTQRLESTLDHWMPRNPYEIEYEQEFREKYLNNLGNLVLSTRARNSSDSNNLPANRSTISTLISRQHLEEHRGEWGKQQIKDRQALIVKFAKDFWNPENVIWS